MHGEEGVIYRRRFIIHLPLLLYLWRGKIVKGKSVLLCRRKIIMGRETFATRSFYLETSRLKKFFFK